VVEGWYGKRCGKRGPLEKGGKWGYRHRKYSPRGTSTLVVQKEEIPNGGEIGRGEGMEISHWVGGDIKRFGEDKETKENWVNTGQKKNSKRKTQMVTVEPLLTLLFECQGGGPKCELYG